ncbi:unnamed protein product [Rotaria socialis]|uniref:Uncharacterized protein n=1 Tax=Rotaria socialis TaxID=392032 RepID=A0A818U4L1_9BILA|nr:unnamed protein product [Rotaria socialis]
MSSYPYLLFFIILNRLSVVHLQTHRTLSSNMNCVTIPLATLSSRSDDKFSQLKHFTSWHFNSNYTSSCGKFDVRSVKTLYAKSITTLVGSLCSILQSRSMLLIYSNEHIEEHHASPAAYLFLLKLFTLLDYPLLTFHFFHPFHPANFPSLRFFQLAPTYRQDARALILLMERYDWNAFSLIIDPRLPGEEELIDEFEEHNSESKYCRQTSCNRNYLKDQKKLTVLSVIRINSINPIHIKQQISMMNPETRVIIIHATSTMASLVVKQASNMSLTGPEYMWIMSSIVLSTYSSGNEPKMSPYDNPNRRKMKFFAGTLALYHDVTRDSFLARFDKHIVPILINAFSKITHLDVMRQWYTNEKKSSHPSLQYESVCDDIFAINNSLNQPALKHRIPSLYNLLKDEFKRAHGIFQPDGLTLTANYSILNFQVPNNEWKKVGEYVNSTVTIADIQWPGGRSKPPPGKPVIYYLKVVTLEEHPFIMLKDPSSDGKCQPGSVICRIGPENSGANHSDPEHYQCCSGFYIDIFNVLKDRLKFEFELYQVLDRTWGGRNSITNKWNGLVAELLENRADLTLTSLKVTTERNAAIDFSIPFMETGIGLVVSLRPGAISTTAFLKPYDYRIWILMLLFTLHGVAIMVFLFEYFENRWTNEDFDESTDEVVKENHKEIYSYMKQFMKRNISQGIKAVKSGELNAFLYDAVVLDYLSGQDDECKLRVVGNWYAMTGYGIGFPKQSRFKEMINKEIIEMHHSGEIERFRRFWFTGACRASMNHQSQRSSQPLAARNFISAFLLLLGGTLIAAIILLCENAYSRILVRSKHVEEHNAINKNHTGYSPMLTISNKFKSSPREQLLERRIENLQERIRELERRSASQYSLRISEENNEEPTKPSFLVLPVTYIPVREASPKLEIVPCMSKYQSQTPLLLVEKSRNQIHETVV